MAGFSATDAALNGFRVVWEKPKAVAWWAGLQFVFSLSITSFTVVSAGPAVTKLGSVRLTPAADPNQMVDLLRQVAPTYIVVLAALLVLYSVLYAAMNRTVLRPTDDAYGYLRLSSDELRQLGLFALIFALVLSVYLVAGTTLLLIGALAASGQMVALALLFVLVPAVFCALVYVAVRLSLASPLTFASHKVDLFGSWRLTRGRFWPMLGAYFIALMLNLVVLLLTFAIAVAALTLAGGGLGALADISQSDMSSLASVLKPGRIAYLAVTAIGTALGWPVTMTPPAVIYRAVAGAGATGRAFE